MNPRKLGILLAIALVLAVAYNLDTRRVKQKEESEEKAKQLVQMAVDTVSEVRLADATSAIVLRKDDPQDSRYDAKWSLVEPLQAPADSSTIRSLITSLTGATVDRRLKPDERGPLADYSLDPPWKTVTLRNATDTVELHLGAKALTESRAFAMRSSEEDVLVIPSHVRDAADKSLFDLRDKSLFQFDYDAEERIDFRKPGADPLSLVRRSGDWYVAGPVERRADASRVATLVSTLRNERVVKFLDQPAADLSSYGLAEDATSVSVWVRGAEQRLRVGFYHPTDDGVYACREGNSVVYVLDKGFPRKLSEQTQDLVDRKLAATPSYSAEELAVYDVVRSATTLMRKINYAWALVEPASREIDASQSSAAYSAMYDMEAVDFVDEVSPELVPPDKRWFEITIKPSDATKPPERIRIFTTGRDAETVAVLRHGETMPALYTLSGVARFQKALGDLLPKPETTPSAEHVESATP